MFIFDLYNSGATAFEIISALFFLFFGFGLIVFSITRYIFEKKPEELTEKYLKELEKKEQEEKYKDYLKNKK